MITKKFFDKREKIDKRFIIVLWIILTIISIIKFMIAGGPTVALWTSELIPDGIVERDGSDFLLMNSTHYCSDGVSTQQMQWTILYTNGTVYKVWQGEASSKCVIYNDSNNFVCNNTYNPTDLTDELGTFNFYMRALCGATTSAASSAISITIQSTYPAITITYPSNTTYSINVSNLNYTYSDTNPGVCWYSRDNGATNSSTQTPGLNFTNAISVDGNNTWTLYCNDSANNLNYTSVTFTVDTINPRISITTPTNNTNSSNTGLNVNYTSSDVNLQSCWYSNDTYLKNTTITCGQNITSVTWAEGQHNVTIWVNDTANNVNSSSLTFTIDTTKPSILINSPLNNSNSSDTGIDVTYIASDSVGLFNCWYSNDTYTKNTTITCGQNITAVIWAEGQHNVTIWVNDSANNKNQSSVTFRLDTTAPNIQIIYPLNNTNTTDTQINVNYTASDSGVGLSACWWTRNAGAINTTISCGTNITTNTWLEGLNNITIYANDTLNNLNSSAITFRLDTISPGISITTPQDNSFSSNTGLDVNYTVSDSGTGISSCWYSNDTMSANTSLGAICNNITTITWSEGQHNVTVWVNDTSNNVNSTSVRFTIDTTVPALTISKNTSQIEFGVESININWTASDANLGSIVFNITYPNSSILYSSTSSSGSINLTSPANLSLLGIYNISLRVNDSAGNSNLTSTTFSVNDTIFPAISIVYPQNTTYKINVSELNYTVSDTNSQACWHSLNKGVINISITCGQNVTGLTSTEGSNTWIAYTNDSAGNTNSSSVTFFKDTIFPEINFTTGTQNSGVTLNQNWVFVNVSINESNGGTTIFNLFNSTNNLINSTFYTDNTRTINWTGLSDGNYYYNVTSNDSVANTNSTETRNITLDTIAPAVRLGAPADDSGDSEGNIILNYNVSDAISSISNCSLIINGKVNITNYSVTKDITQNFTLNNLAVGSYNWSVNCTDINNINNSETRNLAVILTTTFTGATTDVSHVNISSISNLVIEDTSYGRINFSESVDLSSGGDIDTNVNISSNRIEINSTSLPALNKSARLMLHGLTYSNPRVLRDGSVCPSTICTEVSYLGGNFTFDVTQFTVYSAEETPSGGGNRGSAISTIFTRNFSVDRDQILVKLKQGETKEVEFSVTNTGESSLSFEISSDLEDIIKIKDGFTLGVGESKTAIIDITAKDNKTPDIYLGRIYVRSGVIKKEILISAEVVSREYLFDIEVKMPVIYVMPGDTISADISLTKIAEVTTEDIALKYMIKDEKGKVLISETEMRAVTTTLDFTKKFHIPKEVEYGRYVLYVQVDYQDKIASGSVWFNIEESKFKMFVINNIFLISILLLLIILLSIIIILFILLRFAIIYFKKKKHRKRKKRHRKYKKRRHRKKKHKRR